MRKSTQNELNYLPLSQRNNVGFHNILASSVITRVIQRYEIQVFLSLRSSIPKKSLIILKKSIFSWVKQIAIKRFLLPVFCPEFDLFKEWGTSKFSRQSLKAIINHSAVSVRNLIGGGMGQLEEYRKETYGLRLRIKVWSNNSHLTECLLYIRPFPRISSL